MSEQDKHDDSNAAGGEQPLADNADLAALDGLGDDPAGLSKATDDDAKQSGGGGILTFLRGVFSLLLLAGLLVAGYFTWEQNARLDALVVQLNQNDQDTARRGEELAALEQSLAALRDDLEAANTAIEQRSGAIEALNQEVARLRLGGGASPPVANPYPPLAEAVSLLTLAQRYLDLSRDLAAAISLYQAAHEVLERVDDPLVASVRATLEADLEALRSANTVPTEDIHGRLSALSGRIGEIEIGALAMREQFNAAGGSGAREEAGADGDILAWLGDRVGGFFTVSRIGDDTRPALSSRDVYYLREQLRLHIEQAKVALLQQQSGIYRDSLDAAITRVERGIDADNPVRRELLDSLRGLRGEPIAPAIPPLSGSLGVLRGLIASDSPAAVEDANAAADEATDGAVDEAVDEGEAP